MVEIKKGHLLKAVLFDMDGVLFDSMKNHTLAWYRALSSRKIPCERDEFYQYEGATAEWTINLIFERTYHRQATKQEIEELYTRGQRGFEDRPGARFIARCRYRFRSTIVVKTVDRRICRFCRCFDFGDCFRCRAW